MRAGQEKPPPGATRNINRVLLFGHQAVSRCLLPEKKHPPEATSNINRLLFFGHQAFSRCRMPEKKLLLFLFTENTKLLQVQQSQKYDKLLMFLVEIIMKYLSVDKNLGVQ